MKQQIDKKLNDISRILASAAPAENSLFTGQLGLVLYFAYRGRDNKKAKQLCLSRWQQVLDDFNQGRPKLDGASLSLGYGGLLYVMTTLLDLGYISAEDCGDADILARHLLQQALLLLEADVNDPLHGSFGILHTLLYYLQVTKNSRYAKRLFAEIRKKYYRSTLPLIANRIKDSQADNFNLSFAHGQCGMLMILMNAADQLGYHHSTRRFVIKSIDYMLRYKKEQGYEGTLSIFPSLIDSVSQKTSASPRLGWCYGDLGYLILLTRAGEYLHHQKYKEEAATLGRVLAQRKTRQETSLSDPFFCHGSSGVASVFAYLFAATGIKHYQHTANYWFLETLNYLKDMDENKSEAEQRLLSGLPGIGLVLMEKLNATLSNWKQAMLLVLRIKLKSCGAKLIRHKV